MACNSIAVATWGCGKLGLRCNDDQKRKTKRSGHDTVHDAKKNRRRKLTSFNIDILQELKHGLICFHLWNVCGGRSLDGCFHLWNACGGRSLDGEEKTHLARYKYTSVMTLSQNGSIFYTWIFFVASSNDHQQTRVIYLFRSFDGRSVPCCL